MSLVFMFPGQGSQRPGMLRTLPDTPAVRATVADARRHLCQLGFLDDIDGVHALGSTVCAQLALLIAGTASARALIDEQQLRPEFVLGQSVGAFAAAVIADVLTLEEALVAVHLRAQSMAAACAGRAWGMAALGGLSRPGAQEIVAAVATAHDPLWIANINSETQMVLAGTDAALSAARIAARAAGARSLDLLDVAVASHGPLQSETAVRLRTHLSTVPRRAPSAHYLTNTTGRAVISANSVLTDLADAVARPDRVYDAMRLIGELGATCAIQMSPGTVLSGLLHATDPKISVQAIDDIGIEQASSRTRRCLAA